MNKIESSLKSMEKTLKKGFQELSEYSGSSAQYHLYLVMVSVFFVSMFAGIAVTNSHFSDVEASTGNVIQAGTWKSQSEFLKVDLEKAKLSNKGNSAYARLQNIFIENTGDEEIRITDFKVGWNRSGKKLERVQFPGGNINNINEESPADFEVDWKLDPGSRKHLKLDFNSNMSHTRFDLSFKMEDGTGENFEVTPSNPKILTKPYTEILVVNWTEGSIILNRVVALVEVPEGSSYVEKGEFFVNQKGKDGEGYEMLPIKRGEGKAVVVWDSKEGVKFEAPITLYVHGMDSEGNWGDFDSIDIGGNSSEESNETEGGDSGSSETPVNSSSTPGNFSNSTEGNLTLNNAINVTNSTNQTGNSSLGENSTLDNSTNSSLDQNDNLTDSNSSNSSIELDQNYTEANESEDNENITEDNSSEEGYENVTEDNLNEENNETINETADSGEDLPTNSTDSGVNRSSGSSDSAIEEDSENLSEEVNETETSTGSEEGSINETESESSSTENNETSEDQMDSEETESGDSSGNQTSTGTETDSSTSDTEPGTQEDASTDEGDESDSESDTTESSEDSSDSSTEDSTDTSQSTNSTEGGS